MAATVPLWHLLAPPFWFDDRIMRRDVYLLYLQRRLPHLDAEMLMCCEKKRRFAEAAILPWTPAERMLRAWMASGQGATDTQKVM